MEHEVATAKPPCSSQALGQRPGAVKRRQFQRLQAFEDAIAYRQARVTAPCRDCKVTGPGQKCDDHARDLELIDEYLHELAQSALALDAQLAGIPVRPLASSA